MSTVATKTKTTRDQPTRPAPAKCCHRCGSIIMSYIQVLELSRLTHRGPDMERWTLCDGCASAVRSYLGPRPDRVPASPPLRAGGTPP
jgi:hypothetical protein